MSLVFRQVVVLVVFAAVQSPTAVAAQTAEALLLVGTEPASAPGQTLLALNLFDDVVFEGIVERVEREADEEELACPGCGEPCSADEIRCPHCGFGADPETD